MAAWVDYHNIHITYIWHKRYPEYEKNTHMSKSEISTISLKMKKSA